KPRDRAREFAGRFDRLEEDHRIASVILKLVADHRRAPDDLLPGEEHVQTLFELGEVLGRHGVVVVVPLVLDFHGLPFRTGPLYARTVDGGRWKAARRLPSSTVHRPGSAGHAQQALGGDVALDLGGAAHDRGAAGEEEIELEIAGAGVLRRGGGELGEGTLD